MTQLVEGINTKIEHYPVYLDTQYMSRLDVDIGDIYRKNVWSELSIRSKYEVKAVYQDYDDCQSTFEGRYVELVAVVYDTKNPHQAPKTPRFVVKYQDGGTSGILCCQEISAHFEMWAIVFRDNKKLGT